MAFWEGIISWIMATLFLITGIALIVTLGKLDNAQTCTGAQMTVTNDGKTVKSLVAPSDYFQNNQVRIFSVNYQRNPYSIEIDNIRDPIYTSTISGPTTSMYPFISHNAMLLYRKPTSASEINIGDIILYNATLEAGKEMLIVHQVVDKNGERFITKGANNGFIDKYNVTITNTFGVVVGVLY